MRFRVDLGAVAVRCKACGARFDVNGKLRAVDPEADAVLDAMEVDVERCPECPPESGGGPVKAVRFTAA